MKAMISRWAIAVAMTVSASVSPQLSHAQQQDRTQTFRFQIGAGPLGDALVRFSEASAVQFVYSSDLVKGLTTRGVTGDYSAEEALSLILNGSGLKAQFVSSKTVALTTVDDSKQTRLLGPVRVEGANARVVNGGNGSRDITATEGTGSFTSGALTIGSKAPRAIKDTAQSVSVITNERMQQQNINDFTTAMRQLPGIALAQGTTNLENAFYSRGFEISSIQVDGGAPLVATNLFLSPQIDMSVYDHVELLRGAAGLFNGYGDPSGTVNLVRKRPLDHEQFALEAEAGSWDSYRLVADVSSPLALDGKLRGRLVTTYQDNHYFYDTAKDNKTLIYGIAEFDVTSSTLVTVGATYTQQDSVPWRGGLPRYLDGADLELPRSTCLCFPWNRWDFDTKELFGGFEQKLGREWSVKFNLTHNRQTSTQKVGYSSGAVNPTNLRGPQVRGNYVDTSSEQLSAEAVLSGVFTAFGQRQEITFGANRVSSDASGSTDYAAVISGSAAAPYQPYPGGPTFYSGSRNGALPPINVFAFHPGSPLYTEPRNPLPFQYYPELHQIQSGVYLSLRLTAFDRLHLTTGVRQSRYDYEITTSSLCTNTTAVGCVGKQVGDVSSTSSKPYSGDDFSWPPAASLSFDVAKSLTTYVGYADIYLSNAQYVDSGRRPLSPLTGSNWEAGLKWAPRDGKLNLSLAAYRIMQTDFAVLDPSVPKEQISAGVACCYFNDHDQTRESKGVDFEVTGEIASGWQLAASYTYGKNEQVGKSFGANEGKPFRSIAPDSLYKLWTSYDFGTAGVGALLSRFVVSAGIDGQSEGYQSGTTCVNLSGVPDPITGAQSCASSAPPDRVTYQFTVPAYLVASSRIDYRISDAWSLALNVDNLFDRIYYQTVGSSVTTGHWYGAPRSFALSLHGQF